MDLEWMAWTPVTAWFFVAIFCMIACMTVGEILWPTTARQGLLPLVTTRGDRFFIGLLGAGYIFVVWVGFVPINLWFVLPVAALFLFLVMRYG